MSAIQRLQNISSRREIHRSYIRNGKSEGPERLTTPVHKYLAMEIGACKLQIGLIGDTDTILSVEHFMSIEVIIDTHIVL